MGVIERSRSPAAIVKLSPAVTAREVSSASDPRNVPELTASQKETWEIVSEAERFVQVTSPEFVIAPEAAAENVTDCRVVSPKAAVAPEAPGSPVWSLTKKAAGSDHVTERQSASRIELAIPEAMPVVMRFLLDPR
jgi:hypothetical protein